MRNKDKSETKVKQKPVKNPDVNKSKKIAMEFKGIFKKSIYQPSEDQWYKQ